MSRLGKSFKNRFLRQALAMVLAGTMVMSGMPVSFAAETSEVETTAETEVQGGAEDISEETSVEKSVEATEDEEVVQGEFEETEANENGEATEETETTSKQGSASSESENKVDSAKTDLSMETEEIETTETETEEIETTETETEQTTEEEENQYTSSDANLNSHENAKWDVNGIIASSNGKLEGSSGTYTNGAKGDVLYVDAQSGKFYQDTNQSRIQVNPGTKIYIPVKTNSEGKAKIIIYQTTIKNENDVFNSGNAQYLVLRKDENVLSSVNMSFSSTSIEFTITLSEEKNANAIICMEVAGAANGKIYITKIISGEEVRDDVHDNSVGASADFVLYNQEGYAKSYGDNGVTGGGVMIDAPENKYYTVSTADEFIQALSDIQGKGPAVIRITENLNLGSKEFNISNYNRNLIRSDALDENGNEIDGNIKRPLMHPVLKRTGVSYLTLKGFKDLTIFSTNGAAIKHCKIGIQQSENIIFRNLVFDELWEWDDIVYVDSNEKASTGQYDRNDWDYVTIENSSDGIWIDHCTFYKAYDGVIDVKNSKENGEERVTVSWCKFEPKSAPKEVDGVITYPFYDAQMKWLEANKDKTNYYRALRSDVKKDSNNKVISYVKCTGEKEADGTAVSTTLAGGGYSVEDVITYTCGQKKTHLFGQSDGKVGEDGVNDAEAKSVGIRVTLANNIYKNSMDRLPRLRFGIAHEYNCVLDSSELYEAHFVADDGSKFDNHLVSNGAISTMGASVFLENCYIDGINSPILSGNGNSDPGYIGTSDCKYVLNKDVKELKIEYKNNKENNDFSLTKDQFSAKLPEEYGDYKLYSTVDDLQNYLSNKAGAGVVVMNPIRWTKTSYDGETDTATKDEKDTTDPAKNDKTDYSIEDGSGEEGDDKPEKKNFSLDAKDVYNETADKNYTITDVYSKNGFTIRANSSNTVTIDASSKSPYTHRIKLGGAGDPEYRSIHFKTVGAGTLTVYAISSSKDTGGDRVLKLYKGSDSKDNLIAKKDIEAGTTLLKLPYDIDSADDYWIGSESGGINIYYIAFEYKTEEGGTKPSESESSSSSESAPSSSSEPNPSESGSSSSSESAPSSSSESNSSDPSESGSSNPSETDPGDPTSPAPNYPADSLVLDVNKFNDATIKSETKINNHYTIIGTADAQITVKNINDDGSPITVNGKEFKKVIELGGEGSSEGRTIKITLPSAGKLTVYAQSNGADGKLALKLKDASTPTEDTVTAGEPKVLEYSVSEAGTYDLYSPDKNISIFHVEYTKDTDNKTDSFYEETEGNSAELAKYNMEGFAASTQVTGGGLLKEGSAHYYKVTNEREFIDALLSVWSLGRAETGGLKPAAEVTPAVIEIVNDLNLGSEEIVAQGIDVTKKPDKTVIEKQKKNPLMHPTLKDTGVSFIKLLDFRNVTIFSKNGASIKHCGISFEGATSNIIIRNITFDELWEWDEKTSGKYDENDWDYMTVGEETDGLWIDHCTFYKAYDGILDVKGDMKNLIDKQRVTISWCEFLPGSKGDTFFNEQMTWLESNKSSTKYYKGLRDTQTAEDVKWYAYGQKKTHLFGDDDENTYASIIRVTMANNHYKDSMDRMPRLRYGKVHEYNCILDAQELQDKKTAGVKNITSNGAISTCGGEVLLENCQIRGIENPLNSGNGESPTGYINAINSLYFMNNVEKDLAPKKNGSGTGECLITDAEAFIEALPYKNYVTYDASTLDTVVKPYAGAGKVEMSTVQWEKVSYGTGDTDAPDKPVADPGSEEQSTAVAKETKVTLTVTGAVDNIYYTTGSTAENTADPTDPQSESDRKTYDAETGIIITEAVTIKAVAQKGDKYSDVAIYTYTILTSEEQVESPQATPDPAAGAVIIGSQVTLTCATEGAMIYYTLDGNVPTVDSTPYTTPIEIPKADDNTVTIKAFAVKEGWTDSVVAEFQYTVESGIQIKGLKESYFYTGAKIIPDIDVVDYDNGEKLLVLGTDYTVAYKDNTKPTTPGKPATVTVTGKGNYAGKDTSKSFQITEVKSVANTVKVKGAKITVDSQMEYIGTAQYPNFTLTLNGKSVKYTDPEQDGVYEREDGADMDVNVAVSNNINKGTATILVSGSESTSVKATFKINAVDLSKNSNKVEVTPPDPVEYAVSGAVPKSLIVKYGDKVLKNGKDYTVKYSNNKKTGKGSIAITGKGNYTKKYSKTVQYTIAPLDLTKIEVSAVTAYTGIKAGKVKATVVDGNGTALKASQYTLEIYKDQDGSEPYKATDILAADTDIYVAAKAKDTTNLKGTTKITKFKVGKDISKAKVVAKTKSYTGGEIELEDSDLTVTLNGVSGKLKMGKDGDYEVVAYSNNINKGTATAVIRGINGYSGTKAIKFKITQKTIQLKAGKVAEIANKINDIMINR